MQAGEAVKTQTKEEMKQDAEHKAKMQDYMARAAMGEADVLFDGSAPKLQSQAATGQSLRAYMEQALFSDDDDDDGGKTGHDEDDHDFEPDPGKRQGTSPTTPTPVHMDNRSIRSSGGGREEDDVSVVSAASAPHKRERKPRARNAEIVKSPPTADVGAEVMERVTERASKAMETSMRSMIASLHVIENIRTKGESNLKNKGKRNAIRKINVHLSIIALVPAFFRKCAAQGLWSSTWRVKQYWKKSNSS